MIIIIFGATTVLGQQLVKQALHMGHHVKAYGRYIVTAPLPENEKLELVEGTMFDDSKLLRAIKGCDAAVTALEGGKAGVDKTRSLGMKKIVAQMEKAGVKRIVALGDRSLLETADGKMILEGEDFPLKDQPVANEHLDAFNALKASALNWTVVCAPEITEAEPTGLYRTSVNTPPVPDHERIGTGDLAMCMLNEVNKNEFINQRLGISN